MEKELLKLFNEYIHDLISWNRTKDSLEDEKIPHLETFITWLEIRESERK